MMNNNGRKPAVKKYIAKIDKCSCNGKRGDVYTLRCKIKRWGSREYLYVPGNMYIERGRKKLWFPQTITGDCSVEETLNAEICRFEETVGDLKKDENTVEISDNFKLYSARKTKTSFDFMIKCGGETMLFRDAELKTLISEVRFGWYAKNINRPNSLSDVVRDDADGDDLESMLYRHAEKIGDRLLTNQLKLCFGKANEYDCRWLEEELGVRVLPPLPVENNRDYIVLSENVDTKLLENSGYEILHRPYFAMKGYTHGKWRINPYSKRCVDAARADDKGVPFTDFMELFDSKPVDV